MEDVIRLAFSPCPNDTFIFDAIVNRRIDLEGVTFEVRMEDIETLNQLAFAGEAEMIKVSYHAWLYLRSEFELLTSGSALGSGNGPLLISRDLHTAEEVPGLRIALPGQFTTAHLLFRYAFPGSDKKTFMVFSQIEKALLEGEADAGVIIHENRFTYEQRGLRKILDLGEYWERKTGAPVPLGGILAKKSLGEDMILRLNRIMKRSVEYALAHPEEAMGFVRENAREMDEEVMKKHIGLYVNPFTVDLGEPGRKAIDVMSKINDDGKAIH
jgi:1,4-dihydroxy-6-naphthoate synthase